MAYGLLSIPAGFILARIGYKKGILLGLTTMGVGCLLFWPAASSRTFEIFLLGYFVLAGGMTILQVAAAFVFVEDLSIMKVMLPLLPNNTLSS